MNISQAIKNAFVIVGKNIILVQPIIFALLIFALLSGGMASVRSNAIASLVYSISLLALGVAFLTGWLFMTKKIIALELHSDLSGEEKTLESFFQIKQFFPGVGEYFLSSLAMSVIYIVAAFVFMAAVFKLGIKFIGVPQVDFAAINAAAGSVEKIQQYFASLPTERLYGFAMWIFTISLAGTLFQFVTMWWYPALFYNTKNPLVAVGLGTKFLFRKFGASIGIFLFLALLNFVISFVSTMFPNNIVFSVIGFLLFVYYLTYYVVLIFLYYGQNGEHSAKNYIDSGNDSDGQKLAGG